MKRFSDNYADITQPLTTAPGEGDLVKDDEWDYFLAAVFGDVPTLTQLRKDNPKVSRELHYDFPLLMAIRNGRNDAVRFLLDQDGGWVDDGPPTSKNVWFSRCIETAKARGFDEIHNMLVAQRTQAESQPLPAPDETLREPLTTGDVETVARLLESRPELTDVSDDDQYQLLRWANAPGSPTNVRLVELLLDQGVDPNCGPFIHGASEANDLVMVKLLLERGANVNTVIDSCSNCMWTARFSNPDNYHEMHALLGSYGGRVPLYTDDFAPPVEELLNNDPQHREVLNQTGELLWAVVHHDDPKLVDRYVKLMGNEQVVKFAGHPKSIAMIDKLVEFGMNVNQKSWHGNSFIFQAGTIDKLAAYLRHGADLDVLDFIECRTRLGYAAGDGDLEITKFLLENGANPNLPVEHQWARPLTLAKANERSEVADLLHQHSN